MSIAGTAATRPQYQENSAFAYHNEVPIQGFRQSLRLLRSLGFARKTSLLVC
jgi:hypothetical protein